MTIYRTTLTRMKAETLDLIRQALYERLKKKGIEPGLIPGLIKIIAGSLVAEPTGNPDLQEANRRLHFMGWNDFDLDYHTLQLIIAALEEDSLKTTSLDEKCSFSAGDLDQSAL